MLLGVIVAICTVAGSVHPSEAAAASRAAAARRDARPSEVIGRVVDVFGHAVTNATVIATPARPRRARKQALPAPRAQSDQRGQFRFIGLPPGEYVFIALHGEHAAVVSPVMPVDRVLEVVLVVGGSVISA